MTAPFNNKGFALSKQGKYAEAVDCFNKAIVLCPQNSAAYNNMTEALSVQGSDDKAVECCNEAIQLRPRESLAYNIKGLA